MGALTSLPLEMSRFRGLFLHFRTPKSKKVLGAVILNKRAPNHIIADLKAKPGPTLYLQNTLVIEIEINQKVHPEL